MGIFLIGLLPSGILRLLSFKAPTPQDMSEILTLSKILLAKIMAPPINRNTTRSDTDDGFEIGLGMVIGIGILGLPKFFNCGTILSRLLISLNAIIK